MRVSRAAALAAVLSLMATTALAQRQLQLLATITDPNGTEITTLDPKEIRVTENGQAATVLKAEPVERVPKVQILIDNGSGFPSEGIGDLRKGLRALLDALPPNLEVTIVTTAPQPRFLERATTDRQKLIQAVDRLTPDSGAGRFVESLAEATQRMERDKQQDASYVFLTLGTTAGDSNVRDRDVQQIQERIIKFRPVVHVILFNTGVGRTTSGGVIQGELGQAVSKMSGGRYENINVPSRVVTLLPELGGEMAKALGTGSRQFRITVERPGGASGDLGKVALGVAGKLVSSVSIANR
jgi:hypothetical protein